MERVVLFILVDSKKINDPLEFLDFSFLGSDMKITIARWDDLSLLFLGEDLKPLDWRVILGGSQW